MIGRLYKKSFLWRWWVTIYFLCRGVRVDPRAMFMASLSHVKLGRGTSISKDVIINLSGDGRLEMANDTWLSHGVEIESEGLITIGEGTTIQRRCSLNGTISIGRGCIFAPNVFISSGSHIFAAWPELPIREQEAKYAALPVDNRPKGFEGKPVVINDDCWLGVNVVVMPGVEIGRGCIIGANSVVTRSLPEFSVAVGAPAIVKSKRLA
ncbi:MULTISPECIES: acyltransferase [Ralstonia]|jgi:acetyltransferase-like isoleucine patch superfamily enzyme|uniref:Acetyltransferase n=2 Tax=Ralstonia pickettii TaxID=329 RepID=A0ABN9I3H3_RALPI|nr:MULTISPECIES: DapH/DapD/GlmU-related protein [Ralstonia]CAJ0723320.1 Putative acetyltransferase [Ralstonia pickettii]